MSLFKCSKNKKGEENVIVIGSSGTGKVRCFVKPVVDVTGERLLNVLRIRGEYAGYDTHFSNSEIYVALQKCKKLIDIPLCDNDILCANVRPGWVAESYESRHRIWARSRGGLQSRRRSRKEAWSRRGWRPSRRCFHRRSLPSATPVTVAFVMPPRTVAMFSFALVQTTS